MVPLSERDEIARHAKADPEMQPLFAFIFGEPWAYDKQTAYPHFLLLRAVATDDREAALQQIAEFGRRRVSAGGSWYQDDSLIFLLLLACRKFHADSRFLEPILNARDGNPNSTGRRINDVYRALCRAEDGINGEMGFIKLPFLELARDVSPFSSADLQRAHANLIGPGLLPELPPFLQLLAIRAYDLILFRSQSESPHSGLAAPLIISAPMGPYPPTESAPAPVAHWKVAVIGGVAACLVSAVIWFVPFPVKWFVGIGVLVTVFLLWRNPATFWRRAFLATIPAGTLAISLSFRMETSDGRNYVSIGDGSVLVVVVVLGIMGWLAYRESFDPKR